MDDLPPFVLAERDALIAEVYEAFAGVSREGGVSWSESDEVDNYGYPEERAAARAKDRDTSWTQVAADPAWQGDTGIGGWNFLDAIGFRYYLPVQMVRCLRTGADVGKGGIVYRITLHDDNLRDWRLDKWSLLDVRQRRCVKRFLRTWTPWGRSSTETRPHGRKPTKATGRTSLARTSPNPLRAVAARSSKSLASKASRP